MNRNLDGQVALVFGAGSVGPGWGNGKAAAVAYAREGAAVVCVDINMEAAVKTAEIIHAEGNQSLALAADVTSDTEIRGVVQKVLQKYRRIDVLHNNVGKCIFGGVPELSEDEWTSVMDTNVKSLFLACKHVLPVMQEQAYGVITNISSIASIGIGGYDMPSYYTSKAAVNQFTRSIAVKYASEGIRANSILPGLIDTPIIHAVTGVSDYYGSEEKMVKARNLSSPTGKMGDAWDIANVAVFLASKDARYVNGVALPVDGGLICKLGLDG